MFAENKLALASLAMLVFIILFCFVGPLIYHTNQVHTNLANTCARPAPRTCSAATTSATTSSAG